MRRLRVGDKVVMNSSAKHHTWFDNIIRTIVGFNAADAIMHSGLPDSSTFVAVLNVSYLTLYEEPTTVKYEKFYDIQAEI
jgi:hypothetical protein